MLPRRGFSLLELLVVVAILGLMVALLLPAIQKVRESAARTRSQNNLKQIGLSFHSFADSFDGQFPGSALPNQTGQFLYRVLPFADGGQNICNAYASSPGTASEPFRVKWYEGPGDPSLQAGTRAVRPASYGVNTFALRAAKPALASDFPDGLSSTILLAEHYSACGTAGTWYDWTGFTLFPNSEMRLLSRIARRLP